MIVGNGIDIIEIKRIEEAISRTPSFLEKAFTDIEKAHFESKKNRAETIAGCFAAKEAVVKAVGGTIFDVELMWDENGKPSAKSKYAPDVTLFVSISHCKEYAVANAIAVKE